MNGISFKQCYSNVRSVLETKHKQKLMTWSFYFRNQRMNGELTTVRIILFKFVKHKRHAFAFHNNETCVQLN